MKHTLLFLLLIYSGFIGAQNVNIPDANFKNALLNATAINGIAKGGTGENIVVDSNNDNEIQESEALLVYELHISGLTIASLEGINSFVNLTVLDCSQNEIALLDLSGTNVLNLDCSENNITWLNIKNGTINDSSTPQNNWSGNPLEYICADENELATVANILEANNLENVIVNTYCSFTPGGDYNTITGTVTFDSDENGCGAEDAGQMYVKVNISDGANESTTFTNEYGMYSFYTMQGSYTVIPVFENDWFTVNPADAVVNFPVVDNTVATENFCVTANGDRRDVEVVMVPVVPAQPGQNAVYKIVYRNKGNQILSGAVSCSWNADLFSNINLSPPADVQATGYYTWNYNDLLPFESRAITMILQVNTPADTTPVDVGDVIDFTADATPLGTDEVPEDNNFILSQEVVESFSANNIICIEGEMATPDMIGEYLHYVVNFSNTGNASADFVVVATEINPAEFDINSLRVLNTSHQVEVRINGNMIEFLFKNINLAADGHGNILFKLKSNNSLQQGDNVVNNANIIFDYNQPVLTNDATTQFGVLSTEGFAVDNAITIYPNPSNGIVNIAATSDIHSVELYDIQGRLLQLSVINAADARLDISQRAAGLYFIKVKTANGVKVEKILKE